MFPVSVDYFRMTISGALAELVASLETGTNPLEVSRGEQISMSLEKFEALPKHVTEKFSRATAKGGFSVSGVPAAAVFTADEYVFVVPFGVGGYLRKSGYLYQLPSGEIALAAEIGPGCSELSGGVVLIVTSDKNIRIIRIPTEPATTGEDTPLQLSSDAQFTLAVGPGNFFDGISVGITGIVLLACSKTRNIYQLRVIAGGVRNMTSFLIGGGFSYLELSIVTGNGWLGGVIGLFMGNSHSQSDNSVCLARSPGDCRFVFSWTCDTLKIIQTGKMDSGVMTGAWLKEKSFNANVLANLSINRHFGGNKIIRVFPFFGGALVEVEPGNLFYAINLVSLEVQISGPFGVLPAAFSESSKWNRLHAKRVGQLVGVMGEAFILSSGNNNNLTLHKSPPPASSSNLVASIPLQGSVLSMCDLSEVRVSGESVFFARPDFSVNSRKIAILTSEGMYLLTLVDKVEKGNGLTEPTEHLLFDTFDSAAMRSVTEGNSVNLVIATKTRLNRLLRWIWCSRIFARKEISMSSVFLRELVRDLSGIIRVLRRSGGEGDLSEFLRFTDGASQLLNLLAVLSELGEQGGVLLAGNLMNSDITFSQLLTHASLLEIARRVISGLVSIDQNLASSLFLGCPSFFADLPQVVPISDTKTVRKQVLLYASTYPRGRPALIAALEMLGGALAEKSDDFNLDDLLTMLGGVITGTAPRGASENDLIDFIAAAFRGLISGLTVTSDKASSLVARFFQFIESPPSELTPFAGLTYCVELILSRDLVDLLPCTGAVELFLAERSSASLIHANGLISLLVRQSRFEQAGDVLRSAAFNKGFSISLDERLALLNRAGDLLCGAWQGHVSERSKRASVVKESSKDQFTALIAELTTLQCVQIPLYRELKWLLGKRRSSDAYTEALNDALAMLQGALFPIDYLREVCASLGIKHVEFFAALLQGENQSNILTSIVFCPANSVYPKIDHFRYSSDMDHISAFLIGREGHSFFHQKSVALINPSSDRFTANASRFLDELIDLADSADIRMSLSDPSLVESVIVIFEYAAAVWYNSKNPKSFNFAWLGVLLVTRFGVSFECLFELYTQVFMGVTGWLRLMPKIGQLAPHVEQVKSHFVFAVMEVCEELIKDSASLSWVSPALACLLQLRMHSNDLADDIAIVENRIRELS